MGKICIKCQIEKELCEFGVRKAYKDGVSATCKECHNEKSRKWNEENKETKSISVKKYKDNNREKFKENRNKHLRLKTKTDILFRLKKNVRHRIYMFVKRNGIKLNTRSFDMIGCSPTELKEHLEKQFKVGMSWDNHGISGWHIDHIIPLNSVNCEEDLYKLCHYTNLQPLWAEENIKKSDII